MSKFTKELTIMLSETELKNYETFRGHTKPVDITDEQYNRHLFLAGVDWLAHNLEAIVDSELKKVEDKTPSDELSDTNTSNDTKPDEEV